MEDPEVLCDIMTYIRLEYKGEKTSWAEKDNEDSMRALRRELYTVTAFSCYEAIADEFCEYNDGSKIALKRFMSWMDDDTYDSVCDIFFENVIMERLEMDGNYKGITMEEKEEDEITDELERQEENWY